jgi:AraC-like DNA-binding protein
LGGKNVSEAAEALGYTSAQGFSISFKRHYKYAPKQHVVQVRIPEHRGIPDVENKILVVDNSILPVFRKPD